MFGVTKSVLPRDVLLARYEDMDRSHTDCYVAECRGHIDLETYIKAFYTGRLFKIERWLIATIVKHKSSDEQLSDLINGRSQKFSAWTLEARTKDQLLMCDYQKRTRSWFMVEHHAGQTRLYFGSAVVQTDYLPEKPERIAPLIFKVLMPFHDLYSRLLLGGALRNLRKAV